MWKVIEGWNFWHKDFEKSVPREVTSEILKYMDGPEAIYLYGPRRAGKTTVCNQVMEKLAKKHGKHSCLYANFEEPAFSNILNTDFLDWIIDAHKSNFKKEPKFVFFDEIQNVPKWEKFVRSIVDRKKFKIIVTGSSAKLLSSEFSTSLGGRGFGFLVLPFSFREFKVATKNSNLEDYLITGGYPAVVLEKKKDKKTRLLEEYFETAIARDIAARYKVRDVKTLRTIAVYLLTNSGKRFSYNKLRSMTGLSFDAIRLYLGYLEDVYLTLQVPFFSYSMKKGMEKPRKYYAIDTGLQTAISKSFSLDLGRKLENSVAIELFRRGKELQYYSNSYEVDFVVKEGLEVSSINVCYSEKPPERELKSLEFFSKEHKVKFSLLLSGVKEIIRWLLSDKH